MMSKTSKTAVLNAALAVSSLAATLLAAELLLTYLDLPRLYRKHAASPQFALYTAGDKVVYYTNSPSSKIQFVYDGNPRGYFGPHNEVDHNTNSAGFRGKEFMARKSAGDVHVAFFGDSFTFGEGVKDTDTYAEQTRGLLAKKYGGNFESMNFGVGGYNTANELFLLENVLRLAQPDMVVLGVNINDVEPQLFYVDANGYLARNKREELISGGVSSVPPGGSIFRLRTVRLAWRILQRYRVSRNTERYYEALYKPDSVAWMSMRNELYRFGSICERNKMPCVMLLFPLLHRLDDGYPFESIHSLIGESVRSSGNQYVHFVDLFPYFYGKKDAHLWVHPTDQHPNEEAHLITAKAIVNSLPKDFVRKMKLRPLEFHNNLKTISQSKKSG